MDLKLLNHTDTKILTYSSRLGLVRDIIIFHCCSVRLLSAQNQRFAYKLASQEYLGCAHDQQCHFVVLIGSSHRRRAKSPLGTVLIINLLGKGLTPRACMGDGGSI